MIIDWKNYNMNEKFSFSTWIAKFKKCLLLKIKIVNKIYKNNTKNKNNNYFLNVEIY